MNSEHIKYQIAAVNFRNVYDGSDPETDTGENVDGVNIFRSYTTTAFKGFGGLNVESPEDYRFVGEAHEINGLVYRAAFRLTKKDYLDFNDDDAVHWNLGLEIAEIDPTDMSIIRWIDANPTEPTIEKYRDASNFTGAVFIKGMSDSLEANDSGGGDGLSDAGFRSWGKLHDGGEFFNILPFPDIGEAGVFLSQESATASLRAIDIDSGTLLWEKKGWEDIPANIAPFVPASVQPGISPPWVGDEDGSQGSFGDTPPDFESKLWTVVSPLSNNKALIIEYTIDWLVGCRSGFRDYNLNWTATKVYADFNSICNCTGGLLEKWYGGGTVNQDSPDGFYDPGVPFEDLGLVGSCGNLLCCPHYWIKDPFFPDYPLLGLYNKFTNAMAKYQFEEEPTVNPEDPDDFELKASIKSDLFLLSRQPFWTGPAPFNIEAAYQVIDVETGNVLASLDFKTNWGELVIESVNLQGQGKYECFQVSGPGSGMFQQITADDPDLPAGTRNIWGPIDRPDPPDYLGGTWNGGYGHAIVAVGILGSTGGDPLQNMTPFSLWSGQCAILMGNTPYIAPGIGGTPDDKFDPDIFGAFVYSYYFNYFYWKLADGERKHRKVPKPTPFHSGKVAWDDTSIWLFPRSHSYIYYDSTDTEKNNAWVEDASAIVKLTYFIPDGEGGGSDTLTINWTVSALDTLGTPPSTPDGYMLAHHGTMISPPIHTITKIGGIFASKNGEKLLVFDKETGDLLQERNLNLDRRTVWESGTTLTSSSTLCFGDVDFLNNLDIPGVYNPIPILPYSDLTILAGSRLMGIGKFSDGYTEDSSTNFWILGLEPGEEGSGS